MEKFYRLPSGRIVAGLIFILFLLNGAVKAQISTRILTPEAISKSGIKQFTSVDKLPAFQLPAIDLKAELRQDSLDNLRGVPKRFGKGFPVNVDVMERGMQFHSADSVVTNYVISSQGAKSINLIFDRFKLAKGARLLIYTTDMRVLYGPVTAENNPANGTFWTDVLPGSGVVIQVSTSQSSTERSELHVARAVYGYSQAFAGYGESAPCNRDIACPEGTNWRAEGNAVAMVMLANGERFCTGALVNNTCQNLTPYFLTAFHCLDGNLDGALNGGEMGAVNNWVFRFRYDSPSCGGPEPASWAWVTFNGSNFRSAFFNSDFALLELMNRPAPGHNITYAGWSRSSTPASSAVSIHHPNGDVKKISVDNNPLTNVGIQTVWLRDGWGNPLLVCPPNTHWESIFESGTVQPGSSGAPIFDQNHRIVGQLHGDHLTNGDFCGNRRGQYGRFDVSWTGGGTNDTRLSNWLDPTNSGVTDLGPISPLPSVSGPSVLCSTGQYVLNNVPAGAPVTWSVSPSYAVSPSSGSGNVANLTALSAEDATITFFIGCNATGGISHRINIGPPQFSSFLVNGQSTSNATICVNNFASIEAVPNDPSASYFWSMSNPNGYITNTVSPNTAFNAYSADCFLLNLQISNACGSTQQNLTICAQNCFAKYSVYPNPAKDYVTVEFESVENAEALPDEIALLSEKSSKPVKTVNVQEVFTRKAFKNGKQIEIDAKGLPRGTYYLHIKNSRRKDKEVDVIRIMLI